MSCEPRNDFFFRPLVEIYENVAAENQVELALYGIRVREQIDASEAYNLLYFRRDSHFATRIPRALQHVCAKVVSGNLAGFLDGKGCRACFLKHASRDVGCKYL